ncbi:MAG: hypothetical protein U9N34_05080 [Candidatus Cloacimonadota bacterium]|nr:hypothetical protein [Candidatus Cloacimonadota bacterium]
MAQYFSEGLSFAKEMRLVKDQFLNITLPLKKMYRYPKKRIYWEPFYSKSAKGVAYMFHSNKKQFQHFWDLSEKSHDFRKTFVMAFGITPEQFSNEFEKTLSKKTRTKALLFSLGFTWSLLPFLALIVWGIKKFKNKIITDKWAEEDE